MAVTRWEDMALVLPASGWVVGGKIDPAPLHAKLNEVGAEGWELATSFDTNRGRSATMRPASVLSPPDFAISRWGASAGCVMAMEPGLATKQLKSRCHKRFCERQLLREPRRGQA